MELGGVCVEKIDNTWHEKCLRWGNGQVWEVDVHGRFYK